MLLDMSNISKRKSNQKTKSKNVKEEVVAAVKPKKHLKVDFFRNLDLVKKSDVKKKDYVSNEWPINDIQKVNYPKFFCSFDSNLNNSKLELNYQDLDTKSYLNSFGITSPVGMKILNSSKTHKFKRKIKSEGEIEKWCSSDVQLIDLEERPLDDMIRPFDLRISKLTNCPICKKQLLPYHSCLKLNLKKKLN